MVPLGIGVKDGKKSYSRSEAIEAFNVSSHHCSSWIASYWRKTNMKSWTHFRDVLPVANRVSMQRDPKIELNYRWSPIVHYEDFEMKQAEDGNAKDEVVEGNFDYYVITRGNQGWELVQMMELL